MARRRSEASTGVRHAAERQVPAPVRPSSAEQLPSPLEVRVLLESALTGCPSELLDPAVVAEQLVVDGDGLVRARDDDELTARFEPALDALWGLETMAAPDMASSKGRDVDDAGTVAWGRRVMLRLIRAVEIAVEKTLNGTSPEYRAAPMSARKSLPPRVKSTSGSRPARSITSASIHSARNFSP